MNGDRPYTFVEIFSQLAWGFGYCGMPHVLVRFMAVRSEKELKKSWVIAIIWDLLSLTAAFAIAVIGRAYLLPTILGENGAASSESVFIEMIRKVFTSRAGAAIYRRTVPLRNSGSDYVHRRFPASGNGVCSV